MKKIVIIAFACFICCGSMADNVGATIREEKPNAVGGELLGRGILLTLNYERYLTGHVGIGAGLMAVGTDDGSVFILPLYASYLSGDKHNLYLSAGVTILGGGDEFSDYETGQFGTFAVGYHYQSDSGFYVRPIFSFLNVIDANDDGSGLMWPGLCIGGSF
ncbi:MAG: hypothetical protein KOO60_14370 [Gemmatimonadales bacterium]|nr:hypothetical protein [Gemmatimonadales bacterium]